MFTGKMFTAAAAGLLAMFAAGSALAKPVNNQPAPTPAWSFIIPTTSPITINWINGNSTGTTAVAYSPVATGVWSYDGNISNQSQKNIKKVIDSKFGLGSNTLSYVSGCDYMSSCNTGGDAMTVSNTFSSAKSFDYLAVHFGQGELLFKFATPQTAFTIDGLHNGLSNYRAYTDIKGCVSPVPEPDTSSLIVTGLGLLGFIVLRKNNS